jgi:hypothetical protein
LGDDEDVTGLDAAALTGDRVANQRRDIVATLDVGDALNGEPFVC